MKTMMMMVNKSGIQWMIASATAPSLVSRNSRSDSPQGRVYGNRRSTNVTQE